MKRLKTNHRQRATKFKTGKQNSTEHSVTELGVNFLNCI